MIIFPHSPGLLIYIILIQQTISAPVTSNSTSLRNDQATQYVHYVGDPNGRGTFSLISSCVLTLTLCVWSALHLNVPSKSQTTLASLMTQCRWIITGGYAPELVLFTAWRQWSSAKLLSKLVDEWGQARKHPHENGKEGMDDPSR